MLKKLKQKLAQVDQHAHLLVADVEGWVYAEAQAAEEFIEETVQAAEVTYQTRLTPMTNSIPALVTFTHRPVNRYGAQQYAPVEAAGTTVVRILPTAS